MTESTNTWNIGESIPIELFIMDPDDGSGLTGLVSKITLTIQRSDDRYWNGTIWIVALSTLTMIEVDSVNQKGRYNFILPASANAQADRYVAHAIVDDPPIINEAEDYEIHVSRLLDIRLYESQAS